jgi:hypothetical protein
VCTILYFIRCVWNVAFVASYYDLGSGNFNFLTDEVEITDIIMTIWIEFVIYNIIFGMGAKKHLKGLWTPGGQPPPPVQQGYVVPAPMYGVPPMGQNVPMPPQAYGYAGGMPPQQMMPQQQMQPSWQPHLQQQQQQTYQPMPMQQQPMYYQAPPTATTNTQSISRAPTVSSESPAPTHVLPDHTQQQQNHQGYYSPPPQEMPPHEVSTQKQ